MGPRNMLKHLRLYSSEKAEKTEFETGFVIERRRLLWLPLIAAASLILPPKSFGAHHVAPVVGSMEWDDFLKECLPKAGELHKDTSASGQDAYLFWLASMASRLSVATLPKGKLSKFKNLDPPTEFGLIYKGVPFFVIEWRMSPNAIYPPHNHPNVSVCTVGMEGESRIRNFEVDGDAPEFSSTEQFKVRQTHDEVLSPGRINVLSSKRDNIHTFQVGKNGARGIDITTYHGKDVGFSFIDIQSKPTDVENNVFEATWKKL